MASNLDLWQIDPFFSAAEEVQNSADRMESAYRTWKHMKTLVGAYPRDSATLSAVNARRRELITALDTVKWQLEEFERAVELAILTEQVYLEGKASSRHRQFVRAIQSQLLSVMSELGDMISNHISQSAGKNIQGEDTDDFTNFLLGSRFSTRTVKDDVHTHPLELQQPYQDGQLLNKHVIEHWGISGCLSNGIENENICVKEMLDQTLCSPQCKTNDTKEPVHEEDYASSEFGTSTSEGKSEAKERQFFPHYASSAFSTSTSEGHSSDWPAHSIDMEMYDSQDTRKVGSLGFSLGFWRFWKNRREPGKLQVSRSGFKRWKDGDASFGDYCEDGAVGGFSPVDKAGCMPPSSEKDFTGSHCSESSITGLNSYTMLETNNSKDKLLCGFRGTFQSHGLGIRQGFSADCSPTILSAVFSVLVLVGVYFWFISTFLPDDTLNLRGDFPN